MDAAEAWSGSVKLCRRCKENEATLKIRIEPVCAACYRQFIATRVAKRLEALGKETRMTKWGRPSQRKYLLALSFGPSSSALLDQLDENVRYRLGKKHGDQLEVSVVHVDTDLSSPPQGDEPPPASRLLARYQARYPRFRYEVVPLASVLQLRTVDWSALPPLREDAAGPAEQLRDLLGRLPSATSRADILRLLVRHVLVSAALRDSCEALLLGHSTTALAELTLAETAKGRGFSLPLQIDDGRFPVSELTSRPRPEQEGEGPAEEDERKAPPPLSDMKFLPIYYPLRDIFRKELVRYTRLADSPLAELVPVEDATRKVGAVVSHRDMSIEDVMARYFEEVEENYPSVVANVVRTTSKLSRPAAVACCAVCGMALDETGDRRWRGEIGDGEDDGGDRGLGKLCYGCERSLRG